MPISYSEYSSLVDILEKSNDQTYEELMKKEKNVLSTVNNVVNHIKSREAKSDQFVHSSISDVVMNFFLFWPNLFNDLGKVKTYPDLLDSITKDNRIIYIGMSFIVCAFLMFLVESS